MGVPTLSDAERAKASQMGVHARQLRAELRKKLHDGTLSVEELLARANDPIICRMKVSALIKALPGYGPARTAKLMQRLHIAPSRRLQGLGRHQREALLEHFSV